MCTVCHTCMITSKPPTFRCPPWLLTHMAMAPNYGEITCTQGLTTDV
jgi:hypothetical protein